MFYEIKHRHTNEILYSCEADSFKECIERAIGEGANLDRASLRGANLAGAKLVGANLAGAKLVDANLVGANLVGANLVGANLEYANLESANLWGASLRGANLRGTNIDYEQLVSANTSAIKDDYFKKLSKAVSEVPELLKALEEGKVDGRLYRGECACFIGTIANIRDENYKNLGIDLRPDSSCPTERWFLGIKEGDTPENSDISKLTVEWTKEFINYNKDLAKLEKETYEKDSYRSRR